jgi:1-deoxy-D-xylulose-5-phosphate reductoisomerase
VIAQLGAPDMRIPIASALAWPDRMATPAQRLDLARIGKLEFEEPDLARFPALTLARGALAVGASASIVLNAANEVAVAAFLDERIGFGDIARTVERALQAIVVAAPVSIADVIDIDREVREKAREFMPLPTS